MFFSSASTAQAACSKAVESARNFVRDVGPTAAAKSSGLLEFSRIDLANAERGVHRCLSKKKLILPVPLTPIADNNEDVVGLELKHWAELILKRNCWHMLAGLMSPHRDREKAIWKEFRARYKQFEPEHEIFALEASGQLQLCNTAALVYHGDEGRGKKKEAFFVSSWKSMLGRGSEPANRKRVRKDFLKMRTNYIGHSLANHFVCAV